MIDTVNWLPFSNTPFYSTEPEQLKITFSTLSYSWNLEYDLDSTKGMSDPILNILFFTDKG